MNIKKYLTMGFVALGLASCSSDYLDTEYTHYLDAETAGEAAAKNPDVFLNGMWSYAVEYQGSHDSFGIMSTLLKKEVMTEDIAFSGSHFFIYDYQLDYRLEQYVRPADDWSLFYTQISQANDIISTFPNGATTVEEKGLLGQALAMRGQAYYYLIQIFQNYMKEDGTIDREAAGVPILLSSADGLTQAEADELKGRNTVGKVLDQAGKDLEAAVENLAAGYERPSKNYIDYSVASGLLARYYILTQQWSKAATAARNARQGYAERTLATYNDGFMSVNASDVMWGFAHNSETSTAYASFFSHMSNYSPGYSGLALATKMIDARLYSQIDDKDIRKTVFNGPEGNPSFSQTAGGKLPYANLKFGDTGDWTMHYIYMRSAEMILMEAEAWARQGDEHKAAEVLGELMVNRIPGWSQETTNVNEILLQRRIELWGEGFAFFDIKRNNKGIDRDYPGSNHLAGYKLQVPARDWLFTYQIPRKEIQENDLINQEDQNP